MQQLDVINTVFHYAPFIVNLGVVLFFILKIHFPPIQGPFKKLLFRKRKDELPYDNLRLAALFLLAFNVSYASLKTILQYWIWNTNGSLSQAFLPPTTPITYFLGYVGFRFWLPVVVSILIAAIFFIAIFLSRKKERRFFYRGEEYLAAISIFAAGWPALIVYLALILFFVVVASLANTLRKAAPYTSFAYLWLPLALFTLLFGNQIIKLLGLQVLFITGS